MRVLTFQVGPDRLALPLATVVTVVPRVPLYRPSGAPAWLAGLLRHHGRAVPVVDLHRLAGAGPCPNALSSRIVLVSAPEPLGLLAADVTDIRDLADGASCFGGGSAAGQPDLGPVVVTGDAVLRLLDVGRLLPERERRLVAAAREAPP